MDVSPRPLSLHSQALHEAANHKIMSNKGHEPPDQTVMRARSTKPSRFVLLTRITATALHIVATVS